MSELELKNIVGFKAVDAEGNEQQVTVDEMAELVSARIVSAASEISTFADTAAAGTDEFEDQLSVSDTFSWLRTMDGSKNPTLTSSTAAAKVLGGLIGINDTWIRRKYAIKDCNTAVAGVYNVDDTTTENFPTGAYKFGTLLMVNSGFFGSQYFVPDNLNVDPYIYIRSISSNGIFFNKWAKIKATIIT